MNLNEMNFSFGGLHCLRDFGCFYAEENGHIITPPIARDEYDIAGVAGSILLGDSLPEPATFSGTLYFVHTPPSQAAAQTQLRRIAAWLTNGRQRLIYDYEPDRYYIASVSNDLRWAYSNYLDGGLNITFDAQPYAYALRETTVSATMSDSVEQLTFVLDTGVDAPLSATIHNTGIAPITGVTIVVNGRKAMLTGMDIAQGESLTLDMESPIGASFSDGGNALPYATQYEQLIVHAGVQLVTAELVYGSGTKHAKITLCARGRWI